MLPLPNIVQEFITSARQIKSPWIQYLQQFTITPPAFMDITLTGSPFDYTSAEPGNIFISGGTVTGITLTRGPDTIILPASSSLIPVSIDDTVRITYSVLPTVKFIPSYGQNTTNG